MTYRKFQAERIFDGQKFLGEEQVLIVNQEGIVLDVLHQSEAGDDIQQLNGILSPGFINCHCHLELSHMKGRIPERTGLVDFVFKVVTERHHPEEEILQAISDAEDEMLRNGIVAVGDICNNTLTITQKQKERITYYNFIEASGWLPAVAGVRLERALNLYKEFSMLNARYSKFNCSIVPHAPYSVSNDLWNTIQPYFENKVASIHNQETRFEDEFFLHGSGDFSRMYEMMKIDNSHHQPTNRTSLQSYFTKLDKAKNVLMVHNTFTSEEDIQFVQCQPIASRPQSPNLNTRPFFCLCINANLYIEDSLPPIELLRKHNCDIVLGTDSLASNWSLSIADEIKSIRKQFSAVELEEILKWATYNGAKALDMQQTFGSFEKGKKPGIVHFDESLSFIETLAL